MQPLPQRQQQQVTVQAASNKPHLIVRLASLVSGGTGSTLNLLACKQGRMNK